MDRITNCKLPPALLFVGPASSWKHGVELFVLANTGMSSSALSHAMRWLIPKDHGYSKEQIDDALLAVQFAGDEGSCAIIACQRASSLLPAAANRLLKIMEEPTEGWHIILCVENEQSVLSTLRSRCMVYHAACDHRTMISSPDVPQFVASLYQCDDKVAALMRFQSLRDECAGSAAYTSSYLDALVAHWHARNNNLDMSMRDGVCAVITVLLQAYTRLPMPGGEILFWRVLLLHMYDTWEQTSGLHRNV